MLLTNEEKLSILQQHMKKVEYETYSLELDKLEAEAASADSALLQLITDRLSLLESQRLVLLSEEAKLTTQG
jgi:hypothetical protein